jgi:hypothetical protein
MLSHSIRALVLRFADLVMAYEIRLMVYSALTFAPVILGLIPAIQITNLIARQREIGNYDVFAATVGGEYMLALSVCRANRYPLSHHLRGIWLALLVFVPCLNYSTAMDFSIYFAYPVLSGLSGIGAFFVYLQASAASIMLAILVSTQPKRSEALAWLIAIFSTLQAILIFGFPWLNIFLLTSMRRIVEGGSYSEDFLRFIWFTFPSTIAYFTCRELMNYILWRIVQRRFDVETTV